MGWPGKAANARDAAETTKLFREDDEVCHGVFLDASGPGNVPEIRNDERSSKAAFRICRKPSGLNASEGYRGNAGNVNRFRMLFGSANPGYAHTKRRNL